MLKERVLTAAILLPIVIWCVFSGVSGAFSVLAALVVLVAAYEWGGIMRVQKTAWRLLFIVLVAFSMQALQGLGLDDGLGALLVASALLWLPFLWWVTTYPSTSRQWDNPIMLVLIGWFLLVPTWLGLVQLHNLSAWWLLYVLSLVWGADTGAYAAGRLFGKVKLAPRVSPGKTREGLLGGIVLTSILALVVSYQLQLTNEKTLQFLVLSFVTVLASVLGDLLESMGKRQAGIKDSGVIFPGHGGALDRIDSITAATPVFMAGWWLLGGFQ